MTTAMDRAERKYLRFPLSYRIEHWVLTIAFFLLTVTGLVQSFASWPISQQLIAAFGGIETTRIIHRVAAVVLMLQTIYHLGIVGYRIFVLRTRMTMLPGKEDAVAIWDGIRYNLDLSKKEPRQGRYTWQEKIEYWAVIWGTLIMGLTGFMLWNPIATTQILPGEFVPAAKAAHANEALLAALAILVWHVWHAHLKHFNKAIFTGYMSEEMMHEEHPEELDRIKSGTDKRPVDPDAVARRRLIFIPVYGVLAVVMLAAVYFFVAYEETAIATVPPAEQVSVFVPLTPTPIPQVFPTFTPAPRVPVPAGQGVASVSWVDDVEPLMAAECVACHGPATAFGDLALHTYEATLAGGASGPSVVPGEAHTSLLITRMLSGDHPGQFNQAELDVILHWIEAGAPFEPVAVPMPTDMPGESAGASPVVDLVPVWDGGVEVLMEESCVICHNAAASSGGLDVSSYQATLDGGGTGPGVVPGNPDASQIVLWQVDGGHPGQFADEALQFIIDWITEGAPES
ncbi:MAG: cytochrome b/b6 domain-containing protein [Anaerolineae bacterium]|nr:cytochrome b/b6 domain-containing protein [Anaerolineae bacterium]